MTTMRRCDPDAGERCEDSIPAAGLSFFRSHSARRAASAGRALRPRRSSAKAAACACSASLKSPVCSEQTPYRRKGKVPGRQSQSSETKGLSGRWSARRPRRSPSVKPGTRLRVVDVGPAAQAVFFSVEGRSADGCLDLRVWRDRKCSGAPMTDRSPGRVTGCSARFGLQAARPDLALVCVSSGR